MYAQKDVRRLSAGRQLQTVLLRVVHEREQTLGDHVQGVAELAMAVGRQLGLEAGEQTALGLVAELHDIGKVAIPDEILQKAGPLTDEERGFMRQHTLLGEHILASAPALRAVAKIVRSTHERWDGGGYPDGLAGEQIPLAARIVLACDAFEAMTAARPYGVQRSREEALAELRRGAGTQFDPRVVDAFCWLVERGAGLSLNGANGTRSADSTLAGATASTTSGILEIT
jgi:two-component system cell cycle response regulator